MHTPTRLTAAILAVTLSAACQTSAAPQSESAFVISPDCPASLRCAINPPAYVSASTPGDGTYNYTRIDKNDQPRPILGIVIHTTESSTESVVSMSKQAPARSSWNYLFKPDGSIDQSVPLNSVAYNSANRYFNTLFVQFEVVASSGLCDITPAQYHSISEQSRYLAQRFNFQPGVTAIIGHDNVPGISDSVQAAQHWDPGVCFDWQQLLGSMGVAAIKPSNVSQAQVVTIAPPFKGNNQPLGACTDSSECQPDRAAAYGMNFATVYSGPSEQSPLLSDPYVHQDGAAGSTAMNDWGAKAPYGHRYVVAKRERGWTGLWFNGQLGWVQNKYLAPAGQPVVVVRPRNGNATVYGRPMPNTAEFQASGIPPAMQQAQNIPADLTKYSFAAGQAYPVAAVPAVNTFYEGCDKADCTGPGDGTIIHGSEEYLMVEFGHRFAFVKKADVVTSS